MSFPKLMAGAVALVLSTMPAIAGDMIIMDAYMRTSGPTAKTGAAFMQIANQSASDDVLISVASDVAKKVELHTHIDAGNGVMQMRKVEDGFAVPAQGVHMLARGGDHIMFMGLTRQIKDGDMITVTLTFEKAGEMTVEIPVDLQRKPGQGVMQMDDNSNG